MKTLFLILLSFCGVANSQNPKIPSYYKSDSALSNMLQKIVTDLGLEKDFEVGEDGIEQISLAVIDLNEKKPSLGGVNIGNFIYPASVYKMYVAAEVLNQISQGRYSLDTMLVVKSPNDVDKSKEIKSDEILFGPAIGQYEIFIGAS